MKITYEKLQNAVLAQGFRFFTTGNYNLNLVGIRSSDTNANTFNDKLCVAFTARGKPRLYVFDATTDPGTYYREQPINVDGTAILKPGQYRGLWKIGKHRGQYEALVQTGMCTVYRDNDRNKTLDLTAPEHSGFYGINCHRAAYSGTARDVDRWSAGCQVLANADDLSLLMTLCHIAAENWGNSFTYTLLTEEQL